MREGSTVIEVCMPTWESEPVLKSSLTKLAKSEDNSEVTISSLRIIDNNSEDQTVSIAQRLAEKFGWNLKLQSRPCSLPEAREIAINSVETEWFLFLDDDVRITQDYLSTLVEAISPLTGAVQGRKAEKISSNQVSKRISDISDSNTDWVRKRSFRGGTHATLIRTEAARGVDFPDDLHVWEDEYLRRHIESSGYIWIFNHQSIFEHESQDRHPPSWQEGYLQAKYKLRPFWHVCLNLPYALLTGKSPIGYILMILGYMRGTLDQP